MVIRTVDEINENTTSCQYAAGEGVKTILVSNNVSKYGFVDSGNGLTSQITEISVGDGCVELSADCFYGC